MKKLAVIIPAYNEEQTIKEVILDFWSYSKKEQYDYKIYVIDNNSKDNTNKIARDTFTEYGIVGDVMFVRRQGKANAVKYAFQSIESDVYIMIDADCTYWCEDIDKFIAPILNENIDMVIGDRISTGNYQDENKRAFHGFGNSLVKKYD